MTILTGTITSPGGVPVNGALFLQLSQDATLISGGGAVAALPPVIFNLTAGMISGPGTAPFSVPGADALIPSGLTYHLSVTGPGGELVLEKDVAITGTTVNLGTLASVSPASQVLPGLAGDVTGPASATQVVGLRGIPIASTVPTAGQAEVFNGTAWAPGTPTGLVKTDGTTQLTANWNAGNFSINSKNSNGWINVSKAATGGVGTIGNPWTGWDTAIVWAGNTEYVFPSGYYSYAAAPNWALQGIRLLGEGLGTVLVFTGAGIAVNFQVASPAIVYDVGMKGFSITGNPLCTEGLNVEGIAQSAFADIGIFTGSIAAVHTKFALVSTFDTITVTNNIQAYSPAPAVGFLLDQRLNATEFTSTCLFRNITAQNCTGSGIKLSSAVNCRFEGGTSANNNRGIEIVPWAGGVPESNSFVDVDVEVNVVEEILCSGRQNSFYEMTVDGLTHVTNATAYGNRFVGGNYHAITVDAGVTGTSFVNVAYSGAGAFTDNGSRTFKANVFNRTTLVFDENKLSSTTFRGAPGAGVRATANVEAVDGGGFYISSTAANSPTALLSLEGLAATPYVSLQASDASNFRNTILNPLGGNVGIGQTTATRLLDIGGVQRIRGIAAPAVSEANSATLYFDSAANTLNVSTNGGPYTDIGSAAVSATETIVDDTTTNATMFPTWVTAATGNLPAKVSSTKLSFNPSTGLLTSTGFSGPLAGNVTGNVSGTAATVTGAAQSAITSVGTLTGLTVTAAPTFSALTAGSVPFAGTAGLVSQDNSNLFWDNTAKRLGVGAAAAPSATLHAIKSAAYVIAVGVTNTNTDIAAVAQNATAAASTATGTQLGLVNTKAPAAGNSTGISFLGTGRSTDLIEYWNITSVVTVTDAVGNGQTSDLAFHAKGTGGYPSANLERMRITSAGSVRVGAAAIATTATDGFLYIPTCAGTPTGVPTATTGLVPMIYDSTNNIFYIYTGGSWKQPKVAGVAAPFA